MTVDLSSFEGKLVVLNYTEADYDEEGDAVLLYQVTSGRARPLFGVMQLGEGVSHNFYNYAQVDRVIELIRASGQTEVYSPWYGPGGVKFFGQSLGYFDITEDGECWGEFKDIHPEFEHYLNQHQISVHFIHPETYEIKR